MVGYCIAIEVVPQSPDQLKPIVELIDCNRFAVLIFCNLFDGGRLLHRSDGTGFRSHHSAGVRTQAGTRMRTLLFPTEAAHQSSLVNSLPVKQRHVLQQLILASQGLTVEQLRQIAQCSPAPIQSLRERGLIEARSERVLEGDSGNKKSHTPIAPPALTGDQRLALGTIREALDSKNHQTFCFMASR